MRRVAYNRRPYGRNSWSLFGQLHIRQGSKLKQEATMGAAGSNEGVAIPNWECGMSVEFCSVVKIDSLRASDIVRHVTLEAESFNRGTGSTRLAEMLGMHA